MRVLIVYGGNKGGIPPFIKEQVESLNNLNVKTKYFLIKGKGVIGYLKNLKRFFSIIKAFNPDLIHAHYGLSGLFANLQRCVPVITTYHGSDINLKRVRHFSKLSVLLSKRNIFVSNELKRSIKSTKSIVIPCGVDIELFRPMDLHESREILNLDNSKKYILFSSSFINPLKNYPLARAAISELKESAELIEFKNYSRERAAILFNAVDLALMTSYSEGSPQFIKEAMACNCPVVSNDVGDVKNLLHNVGNSFVTDNSPKNIAEKIEILFTNADRSNGREKIMMYYDLKLIAIEIKNIYNEIING